MQTVEAEGLNTSGEKNHGSWGTPGIIRSRARRKFNIRNFDFQAALGGQEDIHDLLASDAVREFIVVVGGDAIERIQGSVNYSMQQQTYLRYIKQQILTLRMSHFDEIMVTASNVQTPSFDRIFALLTNIARCTRQGHNFSIEKAIDSCIESGILSAKSSITRDEVRVIFFTCTAWITMLYPPVGLTETSVGLTETSQARFAIDPMQCACMLDSQPLSSASRPICEVIQEFGPLLPTRRTTELQEAGDLTFNKELLYVSLLNAKALSQIGGIEIVWIDHLSSHLVFDPEPRKLFMFRLPSFCHLSRYQNSAFAKLIEEYYDNFNKPRNFTSAAFMKEIRRSYGLIFSDDSRARGHYVRTEQKRARIDGWIDPYLDMLCTARASERQGLIFWYSKADDFPILCDRLSIIQEFMQMQTPNTLSMLWRDRRNLLQWYTFWAVAIIGGIGIILSITQTVLTAGQLYYAAKYH